MVAPSPRAPDNANSRVKAVLGPTNTGKTHLAIERLCAHSSGAIGFPLRLLAREVYDRVCAIKGARQVALITGEERIEPKDARWLLCTAEAMPIGRDLAFVAIDEAQLGADRERGHTFTDRLLHARGREETMILGSAALAPMVKALVPGAEIVSRPRFSTLSHVEPRKLSRIPPRSAIVAFSADQVYAVAEMLRRFRGGAAVVMGALSPQTRNAQVALYQSGEVDYLVATDAIGMGLNLDIEHVAFAGLSKFDGVRQRRLTPAEMAQIAGRAGRHQRDGSFGALAGSGREVAFTPEEVFAIEEHRFAPIPRLFWREAEPRFDNLGTLIGDLETPPDRPELVAAPEAIDLAVLRRLADEPDVTATLTGPARLKRFWEACSLPDFRSQGVETHARFVARLWQELAHGRLGSDHAPRAIAQLDNVSGDIDTLQGRIAAVRTWAYIAQRPDWVPAREEMAERARAVEARLSDALHARLTERFVNRRTAVLMKKLGPDAALLPVRLDGDAVSVDGEPLGRLAGFRFVVDPAARHADHKLLLAAAERHLPALLAERAQALIADAALPGSADPPLALADGTVRWRGEDVARLQAAAQVTSPRLALAPALDALPAPRRGEVLAALETWLARRLRPLAPLARIEAASREAASGPDLRALLIRLVESGGVLPRADSGLDRVDPRQREALRKLGVRIGALDLHVPALLRAGPAQLWRQLAALSARAPLPPVAPAMAPVLPLAGSRPPLGYRALGRLALRVDKAEELLRDAHARRTATRGPAFALDPAPAQALGLTTAAYARLLQLAGFRPLARRDLDPAAHGPPAPLRWRWQPPRRAAPEAPAAPATGAFAALARMVA
ncbi:MAG: helicase [Sphingomonadales bacterium]|nr:helicase [Sphingomonadales bacterium]